MSSTRTEFPADLLAGERSVDRPLPRKRPLRFLFAFCIGVAATLAWQSYGDAAREIIRCPSRSHDDRSSHRFSRSA